MSDPSGPPSSSLPAIPAPDPNQVLREKLAFYEDQFPGFHFRQRADWSFQHVDPRVRTGLGLDPEQCQRHGESFFARIHPKDRARYWDGLLRFAEGAATRTLRFRLVDEDGRTTHHVLEVRQPHRLQSGLLLGYSGIWFEVSTQAGLEAQVAFQSWQRSLGQLTRILLHDFRNAMTGLQTLLELYSRQLDEDHPWGEGFSLMLSTTLRTQRTVERLSQIIRDESREDSLHSLHGFLTGEHAFWSSLWSRPVRFEGYNALPEDFVIEVDLATLRRFWLQFLLLYRPMEDDIDHIHFKWRALRDGDWVVAEAFPFGLRASRDGFHLELSPCPTPFSEPAGADSASREWPTAEWRQLQEFAEILGLQMAFAPSREDRKNGTLHLFWPAAVRMEGDAMMLPPVPAPSAMLPSAPAAPTSLEVILHGQWERGTVSECLQSSGFAVTHADNPPDRQVHGMVLLHTSPSPKWLEWLSQDAAPSHLIYLHPAGAPTPENLPEKVFTLPSRLPENRVLLELQLQELMR